jgi:hypothetical protein
MTKEEYEKSLREVGWDEDCIFAAVHGFSMGYTRAIADVVEWTKANENGNSTEIMDYKGVVSELIENKFLKGDVSQKDENSNTSEKRVVTDDISDTERLDWLLKNQDIKIMQDSAEWSGGWMYSFNGSHKGYFKSPRDAIDFAMKGENENS